MSERLSWVRERDSWYVVLVMDRVGIPLVKRLARTAVTPDQLTLGVILLRCIALGLFWIDNPWPAVLLWQLAFLLDCMDGQLARLTKQTSQLGQVLDQWGDTVMTLALIIIISLKALWPEYPVSFALIYFWFLLWIVNWYLGEKETTQGFAEQLEQAGGGDSLMQRYSRWTGQHRLKILPISGMEEYVLILPIAFALGILQIVVPFLVLYRALALGLRLRQMRRQGAMG